MSGATGAGGGLGAARARSGASSAGRARSGAWAVFGCLTLSALVAAPAAAQSALCEDPNGYCSALVAPVCLQTLGAGATAAPAPAAPSGACDAQIASYRDCLGEVATQCGGADHDDGLGDLSPEVLAILKDPSAGLTGGAPLVSVMLAARCSTPQMRDFACEGAPALARFMLTSLSPNPDLFRGLRFKMMSVRDGAAREMADLSSQILPAATGGLTIAARLGGIPNVFATCMRFTRDGAERGVVQLWGLSPGPGPREPGMQGFQVVDLSGAQSFAPAAGEDCAAAAGRLGAERGV
ncbi:MAG: hypothetical protein AAGM38_08650 [Pseudomonadota bacterium]